MDKMNKVEYCEHSKPDNDIFVCKLTGFGFVFRCTTEDKKRCPDLEYCLNEQKKRRTKK
jgi:hypothetical protein